MIYKTIRELHQKANPVDIITVMNSLQTKNELEQIGGAEYLATLLEKVVSAANIDSHAKIIREKSLLRRLIATSAGLIEKAYGTDYTDVETLIDIAETICKFVAIVLPIITSVTLERFVPAIVITVLLMLCSYLDGGYI